MHKFYIYPGNNSHLVKEALLRRGNWQEESGDPNPFINCHFIWKPTNLSINEYIKLDGVSKAHPKGFHQFFNHFENIRGICTKTGLVRSLKGYYNSNVEARHANYKAFDTTPTSFLITAGVEDQEYAAFVARYRDIVKLSLSKESIPQKHCEANMWLVKPANMNQGRGIEVFKSLKEINNFLNSRPKNSFWVVQKYIEKPMLYLKRKFDIRVWVVVTEKNEIFVYKKAYIRTSSDGYDIKAQDNYIHLTNNCLQKHGDNYGKHEDGNTLALHALDEYFKTEYPDHTVTIEDHVMPRIKDLIIDTILCTKKNLNTAHRKGVFELFGYDFLIDEDMRTWLIEVNTNPYLGIPNKYIAKILPEMLDDMLELVLDPIFPSKTKPRGEDRQNDYQLIYCENGSLHNKGTLNVRRPFSKNVYPIQALIPPDFWKKNLTLADKNQEGLSAGLPTTIASHSTKNGNVVQKEEEENHEEEAEDNQDTKKRASSAEHRVVVSKEHGKNNIESIHKQLCLLMVYKTDSHATYAANQVGRVLSYLKNWELLSNREVSLACKTLTLIAHSGSSTSLSDQSNIMILAKLLKSQNVKTEIKCAVIETIIILSKDIYLKKKLICNHLLHNIITLCLASCDEKEIQSHNKNFLMMTLKCLINLGGIFNRKHYVPGETRDATKLRNFFIAQGGIAAIWIISQRSLDKDMREFCKKNFLNGLEHGDWERQVHMLELLINMPKGSQLAPTPRVTPSHLQTPNKDDEQVMAKKIGETARMEADAIFYRTTQVFAVEKALEAKADPNDKELESIIDFPRAILRFISLEALKKEFMEYVNSWKEAWEKKEAEEKEKKHNMESEKMKKVEAKKKEVEEVRRQALENFEKRIKFNLKKQQMDLEKRQKEIEEMRVREAEERKKNIENLMNKKAEREKKQLRIRSLKHSLKKHEYGDFIEEDKQHSKIVHNSQTQKSLDVHKIEEDKAVFKQAIQLAAQPQTNKSGAGSMISLNRRDSQSVEPLKDVSSAENNHNGEPKSSLHRPSSKDNVLAVKQHFIPENDMAQLNNSGDGTDQRQLLSEADAVSRKIENERETSSTNFKLPKIQKAGRLLISQKLSNSPYLKTLDISLNKSSVKKSGMKENPQGKRVFEAAPYNPSSSPRKGRVL